MSVRSVSVRLQAQVADYVSNIRKAGQATQGFRKELAATASSAKGDLDSVASLATGAGLALTGAFTGITAVTARFDQAMSSVSAATLAGADDMDRLREAALQAGADTVFSATEAAQGIEELGKAGVGTGDILAGGLAGALDLAAAGQIEVGEAAETAASAMTQFELSGRDVGHIADLLASGAGKAQGSVHDLSMALSQGGLVAAQTGLSLEETTGTLAAFASAGLLGSDAGTSFKTMLLRLSAPTGEAADLMAQLGISAFDASGQFIGMAQLAGNLQTALQDMSQQQRQATLETIFGTDAIRSASVVFEQGQEGIQGWIDAVDEQGAAADAAGRKLDNLLGDIEALTGSLETLAIKSGGGANQGLRILTQGATALINNVSDLPPILGSTVTVLAGVSGVALLAAGGFLKVRKTAAEALEELRAMGPAGTRAAAGLSRIGRVAGAFGGTLIALEALELGVSAIEDAIFDDLNPAVDAMTVGLERFNRTGQATGELARVIGGDLQATGDELERILNDRWWDQASRGIQDFLDKIPGSFAGTVGRISRDLEIPRQKVEALDQALADMARGGNIDLAEEAFARLAEEMGLSTHQTDLLRGMLVEWAAAAEVGAETAKGTAAGVGEIGDAADVTAEQIRELNDRFNDLFDIAMDVDQAALDLRQGWASLREELDDGAKSLSLNTQKGRDNRQAILDQIGEIRRMRQANIDNGMSIDDANVKYLRHIDRLESLAAEMGFTRGEVQALIGKYRDIPRQVETSIVADTSGALSRIASVTSAINGVPRHVVTVFDTEDRGFVPLSGRLVAKRRGGILAAQSGRLIPAHITSSPTVLYGERSTGLEAFVPMRGDRDRSLDILRTAAGWYGARLTDGTSTTDLRQSQRWAATAGTTVVVRQQLKISGDGTARAAFIVNELRHAISRRGGDVDAVLSSKRG